MQYENLIEAAEFLGLSTDKAKLVQLKDLEENQKFFVTFWGHYSAGKSKLINNILGKDILPVGTKETTAVLTYIRYGVNEELVCFFNDGRTETYDISALKSIYQDTDGKIDVSEIDHLEVFVNNDLLKSGLNIVDTPGINTVIEKHQELAVETIEQSGHIIYVLGNSPTNMDRQYIKQMHDCGIMISFIRTKCDNIVPSEEDPEMALNKEKEEIEGFFGEPVEFIAVSNNEGNKWSGNINEIRLLLNEMAENLSEEIENACRNRMRVHKTTLVKALQEEERQISEILEGETEQFKEKILEYENEIDRAECFSKDIEETVKKRVYNAENEAKKDIYELIPKRTDVFSRDLGKLETVNDLEEKARELYLRHLRCFAEIIQSLLNSYFDKIVNDETKKIGFELAQESEDVPVPTYYEVRRENSQIIELYNERLLEIKRRIEATLIEMKEAKDGRVEYEAEFNEKDYQEAIELLNKELSDIPSGSALRVAAEQGIQPSQVFKTAGQTVDLALLLIPGEAVFAGVKAAANATKVAQTLHKMGKVGQVIIKTGTALGKNAKAVDTVRDAAYTLNQVMNRRPYSTKAEKAAAQKLIDNAAQKAEGAFENYKVEKRDGNVLDALSVAYWTEKLGKNFDKPPKMEVDVEEENRRKYLREQLTSQQQQLSNERLKRKKDLGLLKSKEKELQAIAEEDKIREKKIEDELERQERIMMEQVRKDAFNKYLEAYCDYFNEAAAKMAETISENYFKSANLNLIMYASSQTSAIKKEITEKQEHIRELMALEKDGTEGLQSKIDRCHTILQNIAEDAECV